MDSLYIPFIDSETRLHLYDLLTRSVEDGGVVSHDFAKAKLDQDSSVDVIDMIFGSLVARKTDKGDVDEELARHYKSYQTSPEEMDNLSQKIFNELKAAEMRFQFPETSFFQRVEITYVINGSLEFTNHLLVNSPIKGLSIQMQESLLNRQTNVSSILPALPEKSGNGTTYLFDGGKNTISIKLGKVVDMDDETYAAFLLVTPDRIIKL